MTVKEYLAERDKETDAMKEYNKQLIEKYPWLEPRNHFSGKGIIACSQGEKGYWPHAPDELPKYDYEYTELDNMPDGWRIAFGEQMCEEIQQTLEKAGLVDDYRIVQIKSKYATLRWYDDGASKEVYDIIDKYEALSYRTCEWCGNPAEYISKGWIDPYCKECAKMELNENEGLLDRFALIEDTTNKDEESSEYEWIEIRK